MIGPEMRASVRLLVLFLALPLFAREGHWSGGIALGGWYPVDIDFADSSITPGRSRAQKLEDYAISNSCSTGSNGTSS